MRRRVVRTTALVVLTAALLSGCKHSTARQALRLLEDVSNGVHAVAAADDARVTDLLARGRSLDALPAAQFTSDDLRLRTELLAQVDAVAAWAVDSWGSSWAREADVALQRSADPSASAAYLGLVPSAFLADLKAVTKEATKGQVRDALFEPAIDPPPVPGDEQGWQGDVVAAAINRLSARYARADVARFVAWSTWQADVRKDSAALVQAVRTHPQPVVDLLSRPDVQRAAVAYAKLCHGPPR